MAAAAVAWKAGWDWRRTQRPGPQALCWRWLVSGKHMRNILTKKDQQGTCFFKKIESKHVLEIVFESEIK